jgi:hypothetical protein
MKLHQCNQHISDKIFKYSYSLFQICNMNVCLFIFRILYKSQKLLSVGSSVISAVSLSQDLDLLWNPRRGGAIKMDALVPHDITHKTKINAQVNHISQIKIGHLGYILGLIFLTVLIIIAFNRWCCCTTKRSRRNRAVGRLQRVIQAIATRRVLTI